MPHPLSTGIKTEGIGKVTTSHLNFVRTMADAPSLASAHPTARQRWERDVWANQKIQYAGKEQ